MRSLIIALMCGIVIMSDQQYVHFHDTQPDVLGVDSEPFVNRL